MENIKISFNEKELKLVEELASVNNQSVSDYLKNIILQHIKKIESKYISLDVKEQSQEEQQLNNNNIVDLIRKYDL